MDESEVVRRMRQMAEQLLETVRGAESLTLRAMQEQMRRQALEQAAEELAAGWEDRAAIFRQSEQPAHHGVAAALVECAAELRARVKP
jgi:tryptophanyl-tRNA synthetase